MAIFGSGFNLSIAKKIDQMGLVGIFLSTRYGWVSSNSLPPAGPGISSGACVAGVSDLTPDTPALDDLKSVH